MLFEDGHQAFSFGLVILEGVNLVVVAGRLCKHRHPIPLECAVYKLDCCCPTLRYAAPRLRGVRLSEGLAGNCLTMNAELTGTGEGGGPLIMAPQTRDPHSSPALRTPARKRPRSLSSL